MLYIFIILWMLLLTIVNLVAYRSRSWGAKVFLICLGFLIVPPFLNIFLPGLALMTLLIPFALILQPTPPRSFLAFRPLSFVAGAIALVATGLMVYETERSYERLRALYPFESLEGRLPTPEVSSQEPHPTSVNLERLSQLEEKIRTNWLRDRRLETLHQEAVERFVNSAGFGISRISFNPSEANLTYGVRSGPTPLQPGSRISAAGSPGEWIPLPAEEEAPLGRMLEESVIDFVHAQGFGYAKGRRHVAGFRSHRFGEVPGPSGRWEVQSLDLVGILLHDEPRVYVSERLPNMDELRTATTRSLEKFEAIGLTALKGGDDLWIAREGETTRMLGAIRSTRKCIACHQGERGDLLGAFTYTLRRAHEKPPSAE